MDVVAGVLGAVERGGEPAPVRAGDESGVDAAADVEPHGGCPVLEHLLRGGPGALGGAGLGIPVSAGGSWGLLRRPGGLYDGPGRSGRQLAPGLAVRVVGPGVPGVQHFQVHLTREGVDEGGEVVDVLEPVLGG